MAEPVPAWTVLPHADGVEIPGISEGDAREALALLDAARRLQSDRGREAADGLLRTLAGAHVELTPPAPVEQARRLADVRRALLATPAYTHETLAEVRGDTRVSTTRTWVSRTREKRHLFTVKVDGRTVIPALQLTDAGEPDEAIAPVVEELLAGGVDGWAAWVWLTGRSPLLSGGVPAELARTAPARVLRAAARFAGARRTAA